MLKRPTETEIVEIWQRSIRSDQCVQLTKIHLAVCLLRGILMGCEELNWAVRLQCSFYLYYGLHRSDKA